MINKLLNYPYWSALVALLLFLVAVAINHTFDIPADGADRLYSFVPLLIWCVMKARTMRS